MSADSAKILAGVGPSSLAFFAAADTAGPTDATTTIPTAFKDAGWCDQNGLVANVNTSSNTVKGFGSTQALRVLISEESNSFDLTFLETNPVSIAVYNRQAIGSIVPDATGAFPQTLGPASVQTYAAVFDIIDGSNHIRVYCPRLQVSSKKGRTIAAGKEISYGVTLTALPDATGTAVHEFYVVAALAS